MQWLLFRVLAGFREIMLLLLNLEADGSEHAFSEMRSGRPYSEGAKALSTSSILPWQSA
jgi:hypothetical protein